MNTTSEPVPKLGLAELNPTELPHLEVVVRNAKRDIIANVGAQVVALIVTPQNRVLYLEAVSTSDAGAHALMGSVSDPRGAVEFRFYHAGETGEFSRPNHRVSQTSGWQWLAGRGMFTTSRCSTVPVT